MEKTLAHGYSTESTLGELSNEYHNDRVKMIFITFCFFMQWTKVTSALEGLRVCLTFVQPWVLRKLSLGKPGWLGSLKVPE